MRQQTHTNLFIDTGIDTQITGETEIQSIWRCIGKKFKTSGAEITKLKRNKVESIK